VTHVLERDAEGELAWKMCVQPVSSLTNGPIRSEGITSGSIHFKVTAAVLWHAPVPSGPLASRATTSRSSSFLYVWHLWGLVLFTCWRHARCTLAVVWSLERACYLPLWRNQYCWMQSLPSSSCPWRTT
jgi:hypothetical protein